MIILAGGKSKRMGRDKAFLPFAESTLIGHMIAKARKAGFNTISIAANDLTAYNVTAIRDIYPSQGPLSGIHAGLTHSSSEYNFIVSCDLPFVDFSLAGRLARRKQPGDLAVVPLSDGLKQPLAALYHHSCAVEAEAMLLRGERKLNRLFSLVQTSYVDCSNERTCFFNVNTPEDFMVAKAIETNRGRKIPIVSIVAAKSGMGKTTLIRRLIPLLKQNGLRVAVLKSDGHDFQMDREGKDTWQFSKAGADAVAIVSDKQYAVIQNTEFRMELRKVVDLIQDVDVILIESRTRGIFPVIEIVRDGAPITRDEDLVAIATNRTDAAACRRRIIPLDEPERAAEMVNELLGRK